MFGSPRIEEDDINAIEAGMRSGWLGTGPLNSRTAALHLSLLAAGVGPGDEIITTPFTLRESANASDNLRMRRAEGTGALMLETARKIEELRKLGIETPPRPVPPLPHVPADPTPEEIALDRVYQEQCMAWIAEVAALYEQHWDSLD